MASRSRPNRGKNSQFEENEAEQWVECGRCKLWVRFEDSGLPSPYDEKAIKKLKYNCRICKLEIHLDNEIGAVNDRLKKIEEATTKGGTWADIVRTPADLTALKNDITMLGEKISTPTNTIINNQELSTPQLRQATEEINEISRRKLNLIISGMPEGKEDIQALLRFIKTECHQFIPNEDILSVDRLGRPHAPDRPRLLRVKFATASSRRKVLTMRKNLPNDVRPTIYARPDLTKSQQLADKKLREDLLVKGRDAFMIRHGKIVSRSSITNRDSSENKDIASGGCPSHGGPIIAAVQNKKTIKPDTAQPSASADPNPSLSVADSLIKSRDDDLSTGESKINANKKMQENKTNKNNSGSPADSPPVQKDEHKGTTNIPGSDLKHPSNVEPAVKPSSPTNSNSSLTDFDSIPKTKDDLSADETEIANKKIQEKKTNRNENNSGALADSPPVPNDEREVATNITVLELKHPSSAEPADTVTEVNGTAVSIHEIPTGNSNIPEMAESLMSSDPIQKAPALPEVIESHTDTTPVTTDSTSSKHESAAIDTTKNKEKGIYFNTKLTTGILENSHSPTLIAKPSVTATIPAKLSEVLSSNTDVTAVKVALDSSIDRPTTSSHYEPSMSLTPNVFSNSSPPAKEPLTYLPPDYDTASSESTLNGLEELSLVDPKPAADDKETEKPTLRLDTKGNGKTQSSRSAVMKPLSSSTKAKGSPASTPTLAHLPPKTNTRNLRLKKDGSTKSPTPANLGKDSPVDGNKPVGGNIPIKKKRATAQAGKVHQM